MAEDVIVVEANAQVATRNLDDRPVTLTGTLAIQRDLIASAASAAPRRVRILDREPTEEEIQRSIERRLVGQASSEGGDGDVITDPEGEADRPLDRMLKADLEASAGLLGLDTEGTKDELLDRIKAEADRLDIDTTDGSGLDVVERIHAAQGDGEE